MKQIRKVGAYIYFKYMIIHEKKYFTKKEEWVLGNIYICYI